MSWKLLLKMHVQDWELSVVSAAGSELHRATAGGSSEHTGGVRAPFLPWGSCSVSLTLSECQGAGLAPEKGCPFLGAAGAGSAADLWWDLGQIP